MSSSQRRHGQSSSGTPSQTSTRQQQQHNTRVHQSRVPVNVIPASSTASSPRVAATPKQSMLSTALMTTPAPARAKLATTAPTASSIDGDDDCFVVHQLERPISSEHKRKRSAHGLYTPSLVHAYSLCVQVTLTMCLLVHHSTQFKALQRSSNQTPLGRFSSAPKSLGARRLKVSYAQSTLFSSCVKVSLKCGYCLYCAQDLGTRLAHKWI